MEIPAIHYKKFVDYFYGTFKYNFLNQKIEKQINFHNIHIAQI